MFKTQTVDPYPVRITKTLLKKWQGEIRVWDSPQSAIEGAKVLDIIVKPTQARVLEEQLDMFGPFLNGRASATAATKRAGSSTT